MSRQDVEVHTLQKSGVCWKVCVHHVGTDATPLAKQIYETQILEEKKAGCSEMSKVFDLKDNVLKPRKSAGEKGVLHF